MPDDQLRVPAISLIVPTRGRVSKLSAFLDTLFSTTANLDRVEVVLVVDEDDSPTLAYRHARVEAKQVVVPSGLSMGGLNQAGYEASSGRYVMLLNDDVLCRTRAWDVRILEVVGAYSDGIVLGHVNDLIFQESLCTFPLLSREFCKLAGGVCPVAYARYRIDDHIYNVFNLLGVLGKVRIVYMPDVIFEHTNAVLSGGAREYVPNAEIHAADTRIFDSLLQDRKNLAIRLAEHIERRAKGRQVEIRGKLLAPIEDSVSLRRPEYFRTAAGAGGLCSENTRVTIGVVSADIRNAHARTCLETIKKFTSNYDLIILDNNRGPNFNHSREMNRIISLCRTDFLVLMDDDVFVEAGWLDGLLRCMTAKTGVVTPMHKNLDQVLSYAGVVMAPDRTGKHTHMYRAPGQPMRSQTLCSAAMLIDMNKAGNLRLDESYSKYFLDIDFGLSVWEADLEVVVSPYSLVTHVGGGTLQQGSPYANELFEPQRKHFVREWIETGRYQAIEQKQWQGIPEIQRLLAIPREFADAFEECFDRSSPRAFRTRVNRLFEEVADLPALKSWCDEFMHDFIREKVKSESTWKDAATLQEWMWITAWAGNVLQIDGDYSGYTIAKWRDSYYAVPSDEGAFEPDRFYRHGGYSRRYKADDIDLLRYRIRVDLHELPKSAPVPAAKTSERVAVVRLLDRIYRELLAEHSRCRSWLRAVGAMTSKRVIRKVIIDSFGLEKFERWKATLYRFQRTRP